MLLRHVTEQLKVQNWTAVALDFVIVVVGVFIGIQASNWNAARANRQHEVVLVAQMADDLRSMRDSIVDGDTVSRKAHEGWIAIFRALEHCRPVEADPELVQFALSRYQRSFTPNVQRTAYDEMTSLGMFSRLSNKELKDDIARFYALIERQNLSAIGGRADQLAAARIMWNFIAFSFESDNFDDVEQDSWVRADFDTLDHCDNLELRGAILGNG